MDADYLALEDGGSVFREEAGSGPLLILTHDGLLHRETWDAQIDDFARHHRVVRWDRRGYGRSEQPEHAYSSVDDLAQVVRSVTDSSHESSRYTAMRDPATQMMGWNQRRQSANS